MILVVSIFALIGLAFYLLSDAARFIEKLLAGVNGFIFIGGGIYFGVTLLVSGEFIKLMLSIEDNLDEQTYLLKRLVKNSLPKNEPD